jgi:lipopolysaccharide/colanic/teichoic acid biosynthesis glycosyltransferase
MIKRAFDCVAAATGLLLLAPLFAVIAVAIKLDSRGPVFFRHQRIGRRFRPFAVCKFRTMADHAGGDGPGITLQGARDMRITKVGRLLRATKLDELPQLINVVRGDMSLVGPRPEVAHYVEMFASDYQQILQVRPGMTDPASLEYRHEARLLEEASDPEAEYVHHILPRKIALSRAYIARATLPGDVTLILETLIRIVRPRRGPMGDPRGSP